MTATRCNKLDCFANIKGKCDCLRESIDPCSFYKLDGQVTNGKRYPYVPFTKYTNKSEKVTREQVEAEIATYNETHGEKW